MYKEYYHLKENPFNITADPDFFFSSKKHCEAFSNLIYGIEHRKGILVITGEVGTGKTTLCRTLIRQLSASVKTALILNPNFSELELYKTILKDLGIRKNYKNEAACIDALNKFLLRESSLGHNVVLIIDEAQTLTITQLEQIRLLTNIETEKNKLLQIILVGQPELDEKLKRYELRQLNQRIAIRFNISPLKKEEIPEYINHRLEVACDKNFDGEWLYFTEDAVNAVYHFSKGTPRLINILCDRALLSGFTHETNCINDKLIYEVSQEI